ncbi:hypothetical protein D018_5039B, partial [Vibrio parahaemolyticus VP2007-007]
WPAYSN